MVCQTLIDDAVRWLYYVFSLSLPPCRGPVIALVLLLAYAARLPGHGEIDEQELLHGGELLTKVTHSLDGLCVSIVYPTKIPVRYAGNMLFR